jgi:hypothetical protein
MKTKILFFTLCIIVLSGCSGNMEYAYNEKVSSNVLSVKEIYEKMDKDMQEGSIGKKEPRNLKNIIVKRLENMVNLSRAMPLKNFMAKRMNILNL